MLTWPEAFLRLSDASGRRPFDRNHQKKTALCHTRTLMGRMANILDPVARFSSWWDALRSAVMWAARFDQVCLITGYTSGLREPFPKTLTLLGGVRFIAWGAPQKGKPTGTEAFLGLLDASGLRPCDRTPLKTALYHTRTLTHSSHITRCEALSICWDTLCLTVLRAARFCSGVPLHWIYRWPQGVVPSILLPSSEGLALSPEAHL